MSLRKKKVRNGEMVRRQAISAGEISHPPVIDVEEEEEEVVVDELGLIMGQKMLGSFSKNKMDKFPSDQQQRALDEENNKKIKRKLHDKEVQHQSKLDRINEEDQDPQHSSSPRLSESDILLNEAFIQETNSESSQLLVHEEFRLASYSEEIQFRSSQSEIIIKQRTIQIDQQK